MPRKKPAADKVKSISEAIVKSMVALQKECLKLHKSIPSKSRKSIGTSLTNASAAIQSILNNPTKSKPSSLERWERLEARLVGLCERIQDEDAPSEKHTVAQWLKVQFARCRELLDDGDPNIKW